ncbi:hypothetical protein HHI36_003165 [Cryptolaemus montrouzieri]|uniref:Uncharacterized protein n=1 Tax=Cryptolaemus montrouzieri TaxID=559131 RepID=A0ABD2PD46_9CUCU
MSNNRSKFLNHNHFRLMAIFEAGILTKMTQNEYENLGKQKQASHSETENSLIPENQKENKRSLKASEGNEKLQPISIKMVQGAFYILAIGNIFSGLILTGEILFHKNQNKTRKNDNFFKIRKQISLVIKPVFTRIKNRLSTIYRRMMHEAFVATLEYIE